MTIYSPTAWSRVGVNSPNSAWAPFFTEHSKMDSNGMFIKKGFDKTNNLLNTLNLK